MSSKIQINTVAELMKRHSVEPEKAREILEELNMMANPEADDVKPPAVKKQFMFLLSDPTGKIRERIDAGNLVGWVVQIPEDASPHSVPDRIFKAAYDFNASKKGRMLPVKSVGEALESVGAKYFKESELWVKTKMPVGVIVTDNVLPKDEFKPFVVDRRSKQAELPVIENQAVTVRTKEGGIKIDAAGIHKVAGIIDTHFIEEAERFISTKTEVSPWTLHCAINCGAEKAESILVDFERRGLVGPDDGVMPRKVNKPAA